MKKEFQQYYAPSNRHLIATVVLILSISIPVVLCGQNQSNSKHPVKNILKAQKQPQSSDTLCYLLRCKVTDKSDAWIDKDMLEKQDSVQITTLNGIQTEIDRKKALVIKHQKQYKTEDNWIGGLVVEEMPSFPEGDVSKYILKHLIYPHKALKDKVQGRVIVQFWVNKDGSIGEVEVVRGHTPELNDEAVRVVESMPKWKPARQRNQPVRCKYTLPVNFRLPEESVELICPVMPIPEFPGNISEYLQKNVNYPKKALKKGIEGRVIVQMVIEKDGSVIDVQVIRGVNRDLDAEALRVVKAMPHWIPAKENNQPIRCKYTLPVNFILPKPAQP
ncbi:energy transducer TonB [Paludibacter jiangxiensis]|uniref:TonB family C-terminal domain-containing protein n=1 Tax=Paludibacter jiangxiensis TaxID=681398 RepID=A0A161L9N1_9BACT|nr:energy transducer TonB [Paludibacter jiangxiensis]GAT64244.1 TonB family C-terminal domain-containing protein [Paludibacter jiangxiensis]